MRLQNHLKNEDSFCSLTSKHTQIKFTIHPNVQFDLVGVNFSSFVFVRLGSRFWFLTADISITGAKFSDNRSIDRR